MNIDEILQWIDDGEKEDIVKFSKLVGWCFTAFSAQIGYIMPQK